MRSLISLVTLSLVVVGCSGGGSGAGTSTKPGATATTSEYIGTLMADVTSSDSVTTYRWNESSAAYELETNQVDMTIAMTGTDRFRDVNSNTRQKISVAGGPEVLGQISIEQNDGMFNVRQTSRAKVTVDHDKVDVKAETNVEMILVSGTIEDFDQGRTVTLRPTLNGFAQLKKETEKASDALIAQLLSVLLKDKGFTMQAKFDTIQISEDTRIEVSKTSLRYYVPRQFVTINMAVHRK